MKAICLTLVLAATTPALAEGANSPPASSTRDARQQDPYGATQPVGHSDKLMPGNFDSRRQQIPRSAKPGTEKPLGTG